MGLDSTTATVESVEALPGCELSSVCFVRNYVEFHFDGPVLRSLSEPSLLLAGRRHEYPAEGSRDAFCELIGRAVEEARDEPDRLALKFAGDATLEIPKADTGAGAEVAHFIPMIDGELDVAGMFTWENSIPTRTAPEEV